MASSNPLAEMLRQQQLLQQMNAAAQPNPQQFTTKLPGDTSGGGSSTGIPGAADYTGLPPVKPRMAGGGGQVDTSGNPINVPPGAAQGGIAKAVAPLHNLHNQIGDTLSKLTGGILGQAQVGGMGSSANQAAMAGMPNPITGMGMGGQQIPPPGPSQAPIPGTPTGAAAANPNPQTQYGFAGVRQPTGMPLNPNYVPPAVQDPTQVPPYTSPFGSILDPTRFGGGS